MHFSLKCPPAPKPVDLLSSVLDNSRRLPLPPPYYSSKAEKGNREEDVLMGDNPFFFVQLGKEEWAEGKPQNQ